MKRAFRLSLVLLCSMAVSVAESAVRYVWKDNPNTPVPPYTGGWEQAATNIQEAVDVAVSGDTVLVTNGTYNVGGRVAPGDTTLKTRLVITNAITVASVNGPAGTMIVGQTNGVANYGLGGAAIRCVYLQTNSVLSGFTVTNGFTHYSTSAATASYVGGGIRCEDIGALITNCVIVANTANARGGGVYSGTLADCEVLTNGVCYVSGGGGGGLYGSVAQRTRIANNFAVYSTSHDGGGAWGGSLYDCTLSNNSATRDGGGAFTPAVVSNCVVIGNSGTRYGGGVYQGVALDSWIASNRVTATTSYGGGYYGTVATADRLVGCSVVGNSAVTYGGGVYNAVLSNCVVRANRAVGSSGTTGRGGGYYAGTAAGYLVYRSVFLDNEANYQGGGAYQGKFYGCVFSGNRAAQGGGFYGTSGYQLNSCSVQGNTATSQYGGTYQGTISNCIVYANTAPASANYSGGTFVSSCADPLPSGTGNTNVNPLVSGYRDPHLLPGSPCIGVGRISAWMANAVDLDGEARVAGGLTDMGADQYDGAALEGALTVDISGDTTCVVGYSVSLLAEPTGKVGGLVWDFGDGAAWVTNANAVTHVFTATGSYQVRVTVTNTTHTADDTWLVQVVETPVHYVSRTGSHVAPFTTWATAATNIQNAVDVAMPGSVVLVTNGVYSLGGRAAGSQSVVNRVCVDRLVSVCSVNGPAGTAIVGKAHPSTGVGTTAERGVYLTAGASLCGFTVSNGFTRSATTASEDYYGGGVLCAASDSMVSNCVLAANGAAMRGGGVHQGTLVDCHVLTNTVTASSTSAGGGGAYSVIARGTRFERNSVTYASADGGGAYASVLADCVVATNAAGRHGGGVYLTTLTSCAVEGNWAGVSGGGAYTPMAVTNCIIRGNVAVTSGGGVYQGVIQDTQIVSNRVTGSSGDGGGYYGNAAGNRLLRCTVEGNEAGRNGGGVYNAVLSNCLVRANRAHGNDSSYGGGGAYANAVSYSAYQCRFLGNQAIRGGGAYQGAFHSCVFSGNLASEGGGVYLNTSTHQLNSCSVTGNSATNKYGGTYYGTIKNSIVYGNSATNSPNYYNGTITYTCASPLPAGTGNIGVDPKLAGYADPHLLSGSPCIGAGLADAWMTHAVDIDGEARVVDGHTDLGADQYLASGLSGPLTVVITAATNVCAVGGLYAFRAEAAGQVEGIAWNFGDGASASDVNPSTHAFAAAGAYTVSVTVTNATHSATATYEISVIDYTRYVSPSGGHVAPFDTWEKAATNIQAAVDAVELLGGRVLVTNGVYAIGGRVAGGQTTTNRLVLDKAVRVESVHGPEATSIVGRWNSEATPLGPLSVRGVYIGAGAVLDGFTVTNGATVYSAMDSGRGGGLFLAQGGVATNCVVSNCRGWSGGGAASAPGQSGTLQGCVLVTNVAINADFTSNRGGGAADLTLAGCTVLSNSAYTGGGVIACTLTGCMVVGNTASAQGGGANDSSLSDCELRGNAVTSSNGGGAYLGTLNRCRLIDNTAVGSAGGGAYDATLYSCVIAGNRAYQGGGVYGSTQAKGMFDCTVVDNTATIASPNAGGGGFYSGGGTNYTVRNCIVYHNTSAMSNNVYGGTLQYTCATPLQAGVGNISGNPLLASFERPVLLQGSPCVDAGVTETWMGGALDFEGEPRWVGVTVDIGADETPDGAYAGPLSVAIGGTEWPYFPLTNYTFDAVIEGHPSHMHWSFGDGEEATNVARVIHAWPEGTYTLRLTVSNATHSAEATLVLDVAPDTRYVSLAGSHTPPFRTWTTAATNLQAAADAVPAGGRIKVAAGVYDCGGRPAASQTLTNRLYVSGAVEVIAADGPGVTFIVGAASGSAFTNGLGAGAVRGVYLAAGASLQGFTVTGGRTLWSTSATTPDYTGGGVYCTDGTCVLSNCVVSGNASAAYGGGVYQGTVLGSTVEGNAACATSANNAQGGGVFNALLVSNCVVRANASFGSGAGVYRGVLADSVVDGNRITGSGSGAGYYGGGIGYVVRGCTVVNNSGATYGGGVYYATLSDTLMTNNAATSGGGYAMPSATTPVTPLYRCRLLGNRASSQGGGAFCGKLYSCVLSGNQAGTLGGGAYFGTLEGCTAVDNSAATGGGTYGGTANHSILYYNRANAGTEYYGTGCDACCTTPAFGTSTNTSPQLTGLRDAHLLSGSGCIDGGGTPSWMSDAVIGFDMDGESRLTGVRSDIGADERHAESLSGALSVAVTVDQSSFGVPFTPEFRAEAAGKVGELIWDFGDGSGVANQNPVRHAFTELGDYTVRVTVSNQTHSATAEVTVSVVEGHVYVSLTGGHEAPFATWETAATNIQDAVDAAVWGGTVWVTNGVYEVGGRPAAGYALANRVCIDKPVAVRSVEGPAQTVIVGQWHAPAVACGDAAVRGAWVGAGASLSGFTVTNGATRLGDYPFILDNGGGGVCSLAGGTISNCWVTGCTADISGGGGYGGTWLDCELSHNSAYQGGGVAEASLTGGRLLGNAAEAEGGGALACVLSGCVLEGNSTLDEYGEGYGGGANGCHLVDCELTGNVSDTGGGAYSCTLSQCVLTANAASYGGGSSSCDHYGCALSGNTAYQDGGGAWWGTFYGCVLDGNVAENGDGGGFGTDSPYDWLSACTVVDNWAGQNGGGCFGGNLYDCLLTNNAAQQGGGYYLDYAEANRLLYRCRVWDNRASGDGGGVYGGSLYSSVLAGNTSGATGGGAFGATLESCTVLGNGAREGAGGCYAGYAFNSIIYHNAASWGMDVVDTVCEDCCTPEVGAVTSPPQVAGFYEPHLLPGSPCLDAGVNREWMTGEEGELDMDSEARIEGLSTDIGADESDAAAFTGPLGIAVHADTLSVTLGYALAFRAEISGLPSSLYWEFGDGTTAYNQNPMSYAFAETGTYTVRATAANGTDTAIAELQVVVRAGDVFVALDGTHEWPFSTWTTAATNIQDAVEAAPWGGTVTVGDGTYELGGRPASGLALTNRVCIEKPVTVLSQNGPEWVTVLGARHSAEEPFGAGAVRGVYLGHREARLIGITVEGGATASVGEMDGGGVYCAFAANSASNCVVANGLAFGEGGGVHGGSWLGCQMRNNQAANGGGACEAVLTGCELSDNWAVQSGGGAQYSTVTDSSLAGNVATYGLGGGFFDCNAVRCTVSGNTAGAEGGGAAYGTLVSCLVAGNGAFQAGGVAFASLDNCTVSANTASDDIGGAGWCSVFNSIVWGNAAPVETNVLWCYCVHSAVWPLPQGEYNVGGNLDDDPQFVNAPDGNFRLAATSPCVNAGINMPEVVGETDLDGRSRFVGGIVDMGAYEYALVGGYAAMGTPIEWLDGYGLGPDYDSAEQDDPDGDGYLTWEEYVALTDPTNGASFFAIRGVASTVSQVSVSFDTAVGRDYTVQHSRKLVPASWSNAVSTVSGDGGRMTVAVPDSGGSFFYRVRVALP